MALGALELLLILLVAVIAATQLFGRSTRQALFIAFGVMGLFMAAVVAAAVLFSYRIQQTPQQAITVDQTASEQPSKPAPTIHASGTSRTPAIDLAEPDTSQQPAWVKDPPGLKDGKYQRTVSAGPSVTADQCEFELVDQLRQAVSDYVDQFIAPGAGKVVSFTDQELRDLAPQRWVQTGSSSLGPTMYYYARLSIDDAARGKMKDHWRAAEIDRRLRWTGGGAAAVLAGLLGAYVLLRRV